MAPVQTSSDVHSLQQLLGAAQLMVYAAGKIGSPRQITGDRLAVQSPVLPDANVGITGGNNLVKSLEERQLGYVLRRYPDVASACSVVTQKQIKLGITSMVPETLCHVSRPDQVRYCV